MPKIHSWASCKLRSSFKVKKILIVFGESWKALVFFNLTFEQNQQTETKNELEKLRLPTQWYGKEGSVCIEYLRMMIMKEVGSTTKNFQIFWYSGGSQQNIELNGNMLFNAKLILLWQMKWIIQDKLAFYILQTIQITI